jgi:glycosyltransferase involved in cell wall biosynthesis
MSSTNRYIYRYQLVLAGREFPGYPKIRKLVEQLGIKTSVRFLGEVEEENLSALYSGADLFVFPSKIEGYGLPVIEAMACGTPVICSNACSLPEVVGGTAWMIEPDNIDSLTNAIDRLIHSPELREKFAQKGMARCAQLTWDATAQATNLVYQKVKLR